MPGQLADMAVLSADYFLVPDEEIKHLESVLTIVGGKIVYAQGPFAKLAPPPLPVTPDWSPVAEYGGYYRSSAQHSHEGLPARQPAGQWLRDSCHPTRFWDFGCGCFVF